MISAKNTDSLDFYHRRPYIWTFFFFLINLLGVFLWIFGYFLEIIVILLFIALGYSQKSSILDYGLNIQPKNTSKLIFGAFLGFSIMSIIFLVEIFLHLVVIVDSTILSPPFFQIILNLVLTLGFQVVVAISEELVFRGYILQETMHTGTTRAVIWSSFLFTGAHVPSMLVSVLFQSELILWHQIIFMFGTLVFAGLFFSLVVIKTEGQLWFPIGFHFAWNYFQYHIYGLTLEGLFILQLTPGTELLTGGSLGPEAGLLGLGTICLCLLITIFLFKDPKTAPSNVH